MKSQLLLKIFNFFKINKQIFLIFMDLFICNISIYLSLFIRLDVFVPLLNLPTLFLIITSSLLIIIFLVFDIYKTINRFSGFDSFLHLSKALFIYGSIFFIFFTLIGFGGIPRSLGILHPIILVLIILLSRVFIRVIFGTYLKNKFNEKILIYGAGSAGRQLASIMAYSKKIKLVGFLEDNNEFIGKKINNILVYHSSDLKKLNYKFNISSVLLAIPSISNEQKNSIINKIQKYTIAVKTLPNLSELENGNISYSDLRPLNANELLGRPEVTIYKKKKSAYIKNKIILITGGGGSIGSELCKQILSQKPKRIIILDTNEYALYTVARTLTQIYKKSGSSEALIVPILASIQDEKALKQVFLQHKPNIVYHAAAYKHVPLVQINPIEGIKNNVLGTEIMARLSLKYKINRFVLISSDKAVRPTNIMGASKRLAELIIQAYNQNSKCTIFSMVRFGNVLGSSGSVVPLFHEQIKKGGPLTLTHKNVTRFFMTIEEAIHLIIESGGMSEGGEVFILKMGEPVKILELARNMIYLSGKTIKNKKNPNGDIEIKITGLRDGEKMYEEVLIGNNPKETENDMIMKASENFFNKKYITNEISILKKLLKDYNVDKIDDILFKLVSGYKKNVNKKERKTN